ncbi:hypothetical protein PMIN03_010003 [Paraphaeosphaeria minitans]
MVGTEQTSTHKMDRTVRTHSNPLRARTPTHKPPIESPKDKCISGCCNTHPNERVRRCFAVYERKDFFYTWNHLPAGPEQVGPSRTTWHRDLSSRRGTKIQSPGDHQLPL